MSLALHYTTLKFPEVLVPAGCAVEVSAAYGSAATDFFRGEWLWCDKSEHEGLVLVDVLVDGKTQLWGHNPSRSDEWYKDRNRGMHAYRYETLLPGKYVAIKMRTDGAKDRVIKWHLDGVGILTK